MIAYMKAVYISLNKLSFNLFNDLGVIDWFISYDKSQSDLNNLFKDQSSSRHH